MSNEGRLPPHVRLGFRSVLDFESVSGLDTAALSVSPRRKACRRWIAKLQSGSSPGSGGAPLCVLCWFPGLPLPALKAVKGVLNHVATTFLRALWWESHNPLCHPLRPKIPLEKKSFNWLYLLEHGIEICQVIGYFASPGTDARRRRGQWRSSASSADRLSVQCSGMRNRFPLNALVVKAYVRGSGPGDIFAWGIDWKPASRSVLLKSIPDAGKFNCSTPCCTGTMYVDRLDSAFENLLVGLRYMYFSSADHSL